MTDEVVYGRWRYTEDLMSGEDGPDPVELLRGLLRRPAWHRQAAFRGLGSDWWFNGPPDTARAICAGCPVRVECVTAAVETGERYGVWGGTTPDQRRQVKHQRIESINTGPSRSAC